MFDVKQAKKLVELFQESITEESFSPLRNRMDCVYSIIEALARQGKRSATIEWPDISTVYCAMDELKAMGYNIPIWEMSLNMSEFTLYW